LADHQKKAEEEERTIVWVDEAGFYLLPMAVRTWAPRGQTPVLRVPLTHDHLIFDQRHHARWATVPASASDFLHCCRGGRRASRVLLRKIKGPILLIWDGSPIHRGHEIKDFRQQRSG
jgi:hypothetical protein